MKFSGSRLLTAGLTICLSLALLNLAAPSLSARIGESQPQIEERLFADGTAQRLQPADVAALTASLRNEAISAAASGSAGTGRRGFGRNPGLTRSFYPGARLENQGFDISIVDKLLWQAIGQTQPAPDSNGSIKRPPDFPEYIYFKTDDGTPAAKKLALTSNLTGWELRVYMYKQYSGLEIYHRVGVPLSNAQVEAILSVNQGTSYWTRSTGQADAVVLEGDMGNASFLGYDFQRADGQVRAKRVDNDLVLFGTVLDDKLLEIKAALAKAGDGKDSNASAASVHGF